MPLAPDVAEESRGDRRLVVLGRLRPGVSIAAAEAEMNGVASALEREHPTTNRDWRVRIENVRDWLVTRELRTSLLILLTAVAFLLLVACSNVANLQLARATTRAREFGVRLALGASRSRLVRQLLTESALLTAIGGAIGTLLAWLAINAARSALPASIPRVGTIGVDVRVFIVAVGVTAVVALLCGVLPGLLATRTDVQVVLRRAGRSAADQRPSPARQVLVVLQLGLATLLTVGALLLAQSFFRLQQVSLGFPTDHLLTARLDRPDSALATPEQNLAFYDALIDELRALPGVTGAGVASQLPLGGSNTQMSVSSQPSAGQAETRGPEASWRIVGPGFLETLRVPLLRGRLFDRQDEGRTIVLSDGLARQLWTGGEDPIGRQVWLANGRSYTVIGVVGDVRHLGLAELPTATMYLPTSWTLWPSMTLMVRTAGDPGAMTGSFATPSAGSIRPNPSSTSARWTTVVAASAAPDRLSAQLLASFAGTRAAAERGRGRGRGRLHHGATHAGARDPDGPRRVALAGGQAPRRRQRADVSRWPGDRTRRRRSCSLLHCRTCSTASRRGTSRRSPGRAGCCSWSRSSPAGCRRAGRWRSIRCRPCVASNGARFPNLARCCHFEPAVSSGRNVPSSTLPWLAR